MSDCQYSNCAQSTHPSYKCFRITRNFNNRSVTYGGNRATAAPLHVSISGAGVRLGGGGRANHITYYSCEKWETANSEKM